MASDDSPSNGLKRGEYAPRAPTDLRGPCPMINTLANHGYLPRDGRNVRVEDFKSALAEVGVASTLAAVFANPIFNEHIEQAMAGAKPEPKPAVPMWQKAVNIVKDPWSFFADFGMRRPGQVDSEGHRVLNLDQLALHNVVEHDASLTRGDYAEGDNWRMQPELVKDLIAAASDGKALTIEDLAALRKRRINLKRESNPEFIYGDKQHQAACGEITLILKVIGNGERAPCEQVRAFFEEERLPFAEGWKPRSSWSMLGVLEFFSMSSKVAKVIGKY